MAVVLAFRLAVFFGGPIAWRYVAAGGATYAGAYEHALTAFWERINDPGEDPAELAADMSAGYPEEGAAFTVTDFTGTFELRKLQWRLSRAPSGGTVEDQDVMTFHFIKATGGTPGTYVDGTDLPAVETALAAYWTSLKVYYPSFIHSDQYRWYKDGPAFWQLNTAGDAYIPISPNPAIRVTEVDVAGSGSGSSVLPPQTALSVTEKVTFRKNWGRWYLPAFVSSVADGDGRVASTMIDTLTGFAVTFYNACRTASMVPVVFSIPKPARATAGGGSLPAQAGIAFEVSSIQMDNLFDVIRRRRYDAPTYRKSTVLT